MGNRKGQILLTDDSKIVIKALSKALDGMGHEIITAADGQECLDKVKEYRPDLIFLDVMLPKVHGMEVLRRIKEDPALNGTGVIMSTGRALVQDYQTAITNGADYYMIKPFEPKQVKDLVHRYFSGALTPGPFSSGGPGIQVEKAYEPRARVETTYAEMWGTRGSIPVSGTSYTRYGGNTSCLEIRDGDKLIIIDAGSGIRPLSDKVLTEGPKEIHLVIGHTHWDHILGFPFFAPVYIPNFKINIYAAKGFHRSVEDLFSGMLQHDYFPVRLDEMQAKFQFHELEGKHPLEVGGIKLHYHYANHPGSTLCFKVESEHKTIGYATDNEFLLGYHGHPDLITKGHPLLSPYKGIVDFYSGCDTLIHEAQYTPEDYRNKVGWGHSSISNASVLVKHTDVKDWIVTHHDPSHTDQVLMKKLELHRQILHEMNVDCRVDFAYDGMRLSL